MSQAVIDAYYGLKNQIYHSMTCAIPSGDCNCGVDKLRNAIASLQEEMAAVQVPEGIYYSLEHQNFYDQISHRGQGLKFWNAWRQHADKFPNS